MPNKHTVKGKYNEVVGKMTDDKGRELKGRAEHKYGHMKDKAQHKMAHMKDKGPDLPDMDMDVDEKSVISMIVGFTLIVSGLYFVIRAIDEMS
ncbi:hypothetical protein SAMN02745249_01785 [Atopostipes suicloacalis DSM 15692]|uniref:CsbD-like n=1 Tax=Atopostipes suicloacalis DSM 15692 TaxID=1121025 RepID=A0A1M4YTY0_9LACT|nr:CsbD family protein [Atopostipes suicloacalis]SHF08932.1 hypothetical protein SAMN02745249_01785 [Atopostipes suicloacalis DSM 15692]